MLIAGCLGFTELAHVLVQTPQRSRTHAAIRPRLAIASKPQGSHTAVVRAAAAGEMGFQLQAAPLLSTALVFLSWAGCSGSRAPTIRSATSSTWSWRPYETYRRDLTSGDAAAVERREAAQRAVTRRGHAWKRREQFGAREDCRHTAPQRGGPREKARPGRREEPRGGWPPRRDAGCRSAASR